MYCFRIRPEKARPLICSALVAILLYTMLPMGAFAEEITAGAGGAETILEETQETTEDASGEKQPKAELTDSEDAASDENVVLNGTHTTPNDISASSETGAQEDDATKPEQDAASSDSSDNVSSDAGEAESEVFTLASEHAKDLADGCYTIRVSNSATAVLDVLDNRTDAGAYVSLYSRISSSDNQVWFITHDERGFVIITSASSGLVLGVSACEQDSRLVQMNDEGALTQRWIAIYDAGAYQFVSAADSTLCLDAKGAFTADKTEVILYPSTNRSNQRWVLTSTAPLATRLDQLARFYSGTLADGVYAIAPMHRTSLALDVADVSSSPGADVNLWTYGGRSNQVWQVSHDENGYIILTSFSSGLVLDARSSYTKQAIYDPSSRYQKWIAIADGFGIKLVSGSDDSLVLDVYGGGTYDGVRVALYAEKDSGVSNQRWSFTAVDVNQIALNDLADVSRSVLANGTYYIRSTGTSIVLDVMDASAQNGANVILYSKKTSNAANQVWQVSHDSMGYVTFTNLSSGKVLDVADVSATAGARIIQYANNGGRNQKWIVVRSGSGYELISAMDSDLVLGCSGAIMSYSAAQLADRTGGSGQSWIFDAYNSLQASMVNKAQGYSSNTRWLILVDTTRNYVGIFNGSRGNWGLQHFWRCSSGAASTPTVTGQFSVGAKGYVFGSGYSCYYYTQFYGAYLFHSVLYNQGTFTLQDGRLGLNISHGCVRLNLNDAKWIYDTIPVGTKVVVYR